MAGLVRRDGGRRDRGRAIDGFREEERLLPRVVMVGERPTRRDVDRDVAETVSIEDLARNLGAGEPARELDVRIRGKRPLQPRLDREPDDERRDHEGQVEPEVAHERAIVPSIPLPQVVPAPDPTVENLSRIDHIVVLMLENRSFDHMLGYLKLEAGLPVDGLEASMANKHAGKTYRVHHLKSTKLTTDQDPPHRAADVKEQLASSNGGFVANYARNNVRDPDPGTVMGYYNGTDLPVYDHLAREYAVCDRWFSSVPGPTWPNRLYAACGRAARSKDNRWPPLYEVPSFIRHLDRAKVSWRWYAHEYVATLRLIDDSYRFSLSRMNFRYFNRRTAALGRSFLEHAAAGDLPSVSWIDPNFVDFDLLGPAGSNDDHPPSDVKAGQQT